MAENAHRREVNARVAGATAAIAGIAMAGAHHHNHHHHNPPPVVVHTVPAPRPPPQTVTVVVNITSKKLMAIFNKFNYKMKIIQWRTLCCSTSTNQLLLIRLAPLFHLNHQQQVKDIIHSNVK